MVCTSVCVSAPHGSGPCGFVVSSETSALEASQASLRPRKATGLRRTHGASPALARVSRAPHPEDRTAAGAEMRPSHCEERASRSPGSSQSLCGPRHVGGSVRAQGACVPLSLAVRPGRPPTVTYGRPRLSHRRVLPLCSPGGRADAMASRPAGSRTWFHGVAPARGPWLPRPSG